MSKDEGSEWKDQMGDGPFLDVIRKESSFEQNEGVVVVDSSLVSGLMSIDRIYQFGQRVYYFINDKAENVPVIVCGCQICGELFDGEYYEMKYLGNNRNCCYCDSNLTKSLLIH